MSTTFGCVPYTSREVRHTKKSAEELTRRDRKKTVDNPAPARESNPGSSDLNSDTLATELRPPSVLYRSSQHLFSDNQSENRYHIHRESSPSNIGDKFAWSEPTELLGWVTRQRVGCQLATMTLKQIKTVTIPKGGLHGRGCLSPNLGRQCIWLSCTRLADFLPPWQENGWDVVVQPDPELAASDA